MFVLYNHLQVWCKYLPVMTKLINKKMKKQKVIGFLNNDNIYLNA